MAATDSTDLLFSKECYETHRGEVRLHMSHFFLRYLNDIYRAFEGDLATVIVLGEISHHNTTRFFSPEKAVNEPMRVIQGDPALWDDFDGCNAYSMSCATGIPRETVRRKIAELKKRGWIEDVPKQGLRITKACADHFGEGFSLRILNEMLRASRIIEALLADKKAVRRTKKKKSSSITRRPRASKPSPKPKSPTKPKKKKT